MKPAAPVATQPQRVCHDTLDFHPGARLTLPLVHRFCSLLFGLPQSGVISLVRFASARSRTPAVMLLNASAWLISFSLDPRPLNSLFALDVVSGSDEMPAA